MSCRHSGVQRPNEVPTSYLKGKSPPPKKKKTFPRVSLLKKEGTNGSEFTVQPNVSFGGKPLEVPVPAAKCLDAHPHNFSGECL